MPGLFERPFTAAAVNGDVRLLKMNGRWNSIRGTLGFILASGARTVCFAVGVTLNVPLTAL
jgi:hypothetical protein